MNIDNGKTYIIAEAGTSHSGDITKGYELIEAAADAGADCVKFQIVFADEIIHPDSGLVDLPNGKTPLFDVFKKLEEDFTFYWNLKTYCGKKGIDFLATPFGLRSAALLKRLSPAAVKIASPELNHYPLLREISSWKCPVILSTGVSTEDDIKKALSITGREGFLLHCITSYPAPEEEYNLLLVKTLSERFGMKTGISDHSSDPLLVPVLSAALGSVMIEKHITLSNRGSGLDDRIALDPENFRKMTAGIREAEKAGSGESIKKLKRIYGDEKVKKVMGSGIKKLAESEKENYRTTNRSIISVKDIPEGEIFTEENTALLRSEKNIKPGLSPDYYETVLGKTALTDIKSGTGIAFRHFTVEA